MNMAKRDKNLGEIASSLSDEYENGAKDLKLTEFLVGKLAELPYNVRTLYVDLCKKCALTDITQSNSNLILRIIRFLRNLGEQKREKYRVDANIVIFYNQKNIDTSASKSLIPIEIEDEKNWFATGHEIEKACQFTTFRNSFLAFLYNTETKKTEFAGLLNLLGDETSSENNVVDRRLKELCRNNNIGFSMEGGTSCIKIYYKGAHCSNYFLSEATGSWILQVTSELYKLFENINFSPELTQKLVDNVMELTCKGIGSIIIITEHPKRYESNKGKTLNGDHGLAENIIEKHFIHFASMDGAMIIEKDGRASVRKVGVILSPEKINGGPYKTLIDNSGGARHEKAAQTACQYPDDYIIVVSENRTVSFLHGEKIIYWRGEYRIPRE